LLGLGGGGVWRREEKEKERGEMTKGVTKGCRLVWRAECTDDCFWNQKE
jgi:hypothetical protein